MTVTLATIPKEAKALPAEAQQAYVSAYNLDFGWRCSEGHAAKAAWLAVGARWPEAMPKE
ncbi:MAG: hypothetical protein QOJ26_993 [Thermoplasmata archaeon]|nr:hypothetical protein [Thermoplasmata archaeon]MEA3166124.1 hypothetical protein [Thermoplasmata archaeon]